MKNFGLFLFVMCLLMCGCHSKAKAAVATTVDSTVTTADSVTKAEGGSLAALKDSLCQRGLPRTAKLQTSDSDYAIFMNTDQKAVDELDTDITSLYVYEFNTNKFYKLLTTNKTEEFGWYKPDGKNAMKCKMSDIHAVFDAKLFTYDSKLLVEGCFDMRNTFSYIIDLEDKSVLCLPTNCGCVGFTSEEGYAIMNSYAYNTGIDENGDAKGGRHTVVSVFDSNGNFINSMSLEK